MARKAKPLDPEGRVVATNSYYADKKMGYLRVYLDGEMVVELKARAWGLKQQIRRHPTSAYKREFIRRLSRSGLDEAQQLLVLDWLLG